MGRSGQANALYHPDVYRRRFCATYGPNHGKCPRGDTCAFAHSREEIRSPLLSEPEHNQDPNAMTDDFIMYKFKTLWCPVGQPHDWHTCVYAHTHQDVRRHPGVGYGSRPCPDWNREGTTLEYSQRCPRGLCCPFSHGAKEQLYHPAYFKANSCNDCANCERSRFCAFWHEKSEQKVPVKSEDDFNYKQPIPEFRLHLALQPGFLSPIPFETIEKGKKGRSPKNMEICTVSSLNLMDATQKPKMLGPSLTNDASFRKKDRKATPTALSITVDSDEVLVSDATSKFLQEQAQWRQRACQNTAQANELIELNTSTPRSKKGPRNGFMPKSKLQGVDKTRAKLPWLQNSSANQPVIPNPCPWPNNNMMVPACDLSPANFPGQMMYVFIPAPERTLPSTTSSEMTQPQPCPMWGSAHSPVANTNLGFAPAVSYSSHSAAPPFPSCLRSAEGCRLTPNVDVVNQGADAIPTYDCFFQSPLKSAEIGARADESETDDMLHGGYCHTPSTWGD